MELFKDVSLAVLLLVGYIAVVILAARGVEKIIYRVNRHKLRSDIALWDDLAEADRKKIARW